MYLEEECTKRDGITCTNGWITPQKKNSAKKEGVPPRERRIIEKEKEPSKKG